MSIKALPVLSEPIYLRDISDDVKKLEGKCSPAERAWVMVRQGTEADNLQRAAMRSQYTLRWQVDGSAEELRDVNQRQLWTMEVYMTLTDAGNLWADDAEKEPLFEFENKGSYSGTSYDYEEFENRYGLLPSIVTTAILRAVYSLNPDWSWMAPLEKTKGSKSEGEA